MAKVTKNDIVYDLGWGKERCHPRSRTSAAKHGVGIEIDPDILEWQGESEERRIRDRSISSWATS